MIRLFERHTVRTVHELCGLWDFVSEKHPGKHYRMPVPSCWEMHPDFLTYRGRGVYETTVSLPRDTHLRIVFAGVSHTADVDFDGNIEIRDATWIQRSVADIEIPFTISKATADVDGDDNITVMDATAIQYYLAPLKTNYAIGETVS